MNRKLIISLVFLVIVGSLYRIIPNRPMGFSPQIAMALYSGCVFANNKKWAFILPLLTMFISDCLYQILYINHMTEIQGFYSGQWINYLMVSGLAIFGFNLSSMTKLFAGIFAAPTVYFLISNFLVFISGGGYNRSTLFECYIDGFPFYVNSLWATLLFTTVLLGARNFVKVIKKEEKYEF